MRATTNSKTAGPATAVTQTRHRRTARQNGQILVIFAGAIITLLGIVAVVVDVSWYWANSLRVQRTADAAALAGAIYLPGNTTNAYLYARTEATKNGYTAGAGVTVTPLQDTVNGGTDPRQLDVTVSAPVQTFFMRVFGLNSIQATRTAKAIYVQPVPMGSPQAFYGVGCFDFSATHATCSTVGNSNGASGIPSSTGGTVFTGTQLNSQGFFGAVQTKGGNQSNGDAISPENNGTSCGSSCGSNTNYDPNGYSYNVDFTAAGGSIYVFDPAFCAMGSNSNGAGNQGTGDHWLNGTNPVSTYYNVYNTNGTAFTTADDTLVASSGTLFENQSQSDQTNGGPTGSGISNCAASSTHDKWWLVGQGNGTTASSLSSGTYRLQITTTNSSNASINASTDAENMFSIMATGGGSADVHGSGRMAAYNNLALGTQKFYLAQIDQTAAGKTLEIDLFDPGDVSGGAWLRVLDPDGGVYNPATFSWSADANASSGHTSGSSTTCIQTNGGSTTGLTPPSGCPNTTSGGSFFQNSWIKILIPLPTTYGSGGLTPSGESQAGWWKIEYTVGLGSDLTTWEVNVLGNPVHLVVP